MVSVPLIALTMVEEQCSLLFGRFRRPSANGSGTKRDAVDSKGNSNCISNGTVSGSSNGIKKSKSSKRNGSSDDCNSSGTSSNGNCNNTSGVGSSSTNGHSSGISGSNGTSKRSGVAGAATFRKSSAAAPFDDASSKPTMVDPSVAAAADPASADVICDSGICSGGVSSLIKRMNARWLLLLMGVSVRTEGMRDSFLSQPAMLLFSHVSTLDAMIILSTFPRALCAVVKVGSGIGDPAYVRT